MQQAIKQKDVRLLINQQSILHLLSINGVLSVKEALPTFQLHQVKFTSNELYQISHGVNSVTFRGSILWNALTDDITTCDNVVAFKKKMLFSL